MGAIFNKIIPTEHQTQKITRDIWDFGDSLIVGNKTSNTIKCWEAVDRYCITIDNNEIYVDLFAEGGIGHGPCERQSQEVERITAGEYIVDRHNALTELHIPITSPYDIDSDAVTEFIRSADMDTHWLKVNAKEIKQRVYSSARNLRVDRANAPASIPLVVERPKRANPSQKISKGK